MILQPISRCLIPRAYTASNVFIRVLLCVGLVGAVSLSRKTPETVFGTWLEVCRATPTPIEKVVLVGGPFCTVADSSLPSSSVLHGVLDNNKGPLTEGIESWPREAKASESFDLVVSDKMC